MCLLLFLGLDRVSVEKRGVDWELLKTNPYLVPPLSSTLPMGERRARRAPIHAPQGVNPKLGTPGHYTLISNPYTGTSLIRTSPPPGPYSSCRTLQGYLAHKKTPTPLEPP